jgi:hypothetical protein
MQHRVGVLDAVDKYGLVALLSVAAIAVCERHAAHSGDADFEAAAVRLLDLEAAEALGVDCSYP